MDLANDPEWGCPKIIDQFSNQGWARVSGHVRHVGGTLGREDQELCGGIADAIKRIAPVGIVVSACPRNGRDYGGIQEPCRRPAGNGCGGRTDRGVAGKRTVPQQPVRAC